MRAVDAADLFFPHVGLGGWRVTLAVVLAVAGFPVALILGWVFDVTPAGVRRTGRTPDIPPAAVPGPWRAATVAPVALLPLANLMNDAEQE